MRLTATVFCIAGLLAGLTACNTGPTFSGIKSVKVRHIGQTGLTETPIDKLKERELITCLGQTKEITEQQALRDLLQTTYLLEISDGIGDRSFELYTAENMKGNKGKYYMNRCVHKLIRDLK